MVTTESLSQYYLENLLHNLAQQVISETVCGYQQNEAVLKQYHASNDLFAEDKRAQTTGEVSSPTPDPAAKKIPTSFIPSTSQTLAGLNNKELLSYIDNQDNNNKATGDGSSNKNGANDKNINNVTGAMAMALSDTFDHSASATPGPANLGSSITSAAVNTLKDEVVYLNCENCKRTIATNRFAQHLERCLSSRTRK